MGNHSGDDEEPGASHEGEGSAGARATERTAALTGAGSEIVENVGKLLEDTHDPALEEAARDLGYVHQGLEYTQGAIERSRAVGESVRTAAREGTATGGIAAADAVVGALGNDVGFVHGLPFGEDVQRAMAYAREGLALAGVGLDAARTIAEIAGSGHGGSPLPVVRYEFEAQGQTVDTYRVLRFSAVEAMSDLYDYNIELVAPEPEANPDELLGKTARFAVVRGRLQRNTFGVIRRVEDLGVQSGGRRARVHLVPRLWHLAQRRDCRIFQRMKVPAIVRTVIEAAGYQLGQDLTLELDEALYLEREYCVQYRESDLDFVRRLLEQEGIGFCFEQPDHAPAAEHLVLSDRIQAHQQVPTLDDHAVAVGGEEASLAEVETLARFEWTKELQPTSVKLRDYDFTRPGAIVEGAETVAQPPGGERPIYDYPGRVTFDQYTEHQFTVDNSLFLASNALGAWTTAGQVGRGASNVTGFLAGRRFSVAEHRRHDLDREYLITVLRVSGEAPEELHASAADAQARGSIYRNELECIPADVPFGPPLRTPRPVVRGPHTAVVVDEQGELHTTGDDIHTDYHGRVRVRFHWDRGGQTGGTHDTCWLRVAQSWAGPGYGTLFIPRVGMEVVVSFLEGDPDRPLITGCVYNGANTVPYDLEGSEAGRNKTVSTIKTNSTPGGGGFNELRFTDDKDREEVFLHAQRDLNERVRRSHTTTVRANQVNTVGGNQTEEVTGQQVQVVKDHQILEVHKSRARQVLENEAVDIKGNRLLVVERTQRTNVVGDLLTVVGESVGADDYPAVTGAAMKVAEKYDLDAREIELRAGGCLLKMTEGRIDVKAAEAIRLHIGDSGTFVEVTAGGIRVVGPVVHVGNGEPGENAGMTLAQNVSVKGMDVDIDATRKFFAAAKEAIVRGSTRVVIAGSGAVGAFENGEVKLNS